MKQNTTILIFHLLITASAFGQIGDLITERIIYTVRFDDTSGHEGGFYNHFETITKKNIINQLCDLVHTRQLSVCYYWGDHVGNLPGAEARKDLVESYFSWNDTMVYKPDEKKYKIEGDKKRDNHVYRNFINSLSFLEQWYFDGDKNTFLKKVNGVILFEDKYTHNIGMTCNYYVPLNDSTPNEYNPANLIGRIIYDVPVTKASDQTFNDDNWWFNYLEPSRRESFFGFLEIKALQDTVMPIEVYNGRFPYDTLIERTPYINTGLSGEYFYGRTMWYSSDPLMFGMTDAKIQSCCYELSDWTTIKKIRFDEEWYFDPKKFRFEKKVLGIAMIVDTFNDQGEKTGEKSLIYYKLN